jgi:hypothetical protein
MALGKKITVATMIAAKLNSLGVRRMIGIPGGGSSPDLIAECAQQSIAVHLAEREDSTVMMAAVTAELTGLPGVVLTTKGPGTANAVIGVAYASLNRAPVLVASKEKGVVSDAHANFMGIFTDGEGRAVVPGRLTMSGTIGLLCRTLLPGMAPHLSMWCSTPKDTPNSLRPYAASNPAHTGR